MAPNATRKNNAQRFKTHKKYETVSPLVYEKVPLMMKFDKLKRKLNNIPHILSQKFKASSITLNYITLCNSFVGIFL